MSNVPIKEGHPLHNWAVRGMLRPHAFIQWKGTQVCMDFYCLCGYQFHVDDTFTYAVKCPHCERVFVMSAMIEAREIDPKDWDGCEPVLGEDDDYK